MRIVLFILFIGLFSCKNKGNEEKPVDRIPEKELTSDSIVSDSTDESSPIDITVDSSLPLYSFELDVFYTLAYCGGAAPNEEMLAELKTPRRLTGSELILIEIRSKEKFVVRTTGGADFMIPQGEYELFLTRKINRDEAYHFNPDCKKLLTKSLRKFKVDKSIKESITIHFDCDQCDPTIKMRP